MTVKLKPKQTIIALDVNSLEEIKSLLAIIDKDIFRLKVGKQLFTSQGPKAIDELKSLGFDIFLDLKLHDIPNTVSKSLENICNLGVWMSNIHLLGGQEMIQEASTTIKKLNSDMILVGVTILTSLDETNLVELGLNFNTEEMAIKLAKLGKQNGVDGVVCSTEDISGIKASFGGNFLSVTPGVRMLQDNNDQKRVGSLYDAIQFGTDFVVVGREITQAKNPKEVLKKIESLIV
tara:strand:+ start:664 stop:1365 length:702 start_codon:yes stop_codon:yes gene_type:complete